MTQPTLSAGVKQLEEQMGVLLVNRGSRFQGFTPEGERVLEWARRIVGDTRAMRQEINALRHGLAGTCASPPSRPRSPWSPRSPRPIASATRTSDSPSIRATRSRCSRLLENLEIDAGITYVENEPLGRVQRGAALSRALPAAHRGRRAARQPRQRDLGGGGAGAALPAHARHAEPAHHRPPAARAPAAKSRPTLESNSMILLFSPRAHRALGERDAGAAGGTWGSPTPSAPFRSRSRKRCRPSAWWCRRASR